jgi:predicted alpha/beta superfamily hydrolase
VGRRTSFLVTVALVGAWLASAGAAQGGVEIIAARDRIAAEEIVVRSAILGEERTIWVRLPRQGAGLERFPVLVMLDAEWHFDIAASDVALLAEASYLGQHPIPPMIVVGIVNRDRNRDFTPTHCDPCEGMRFPTSGESARFRRFLVDEVLPAIDARYPTAPFRVLAGWSLGGLFTVETFLAEPEAFRAYLAISPSLWWDDRRTERSLEGETAPVTSSAARRLAITLGSREVDTLVERSTLAFVQHLEAHPTPDGELDVIRLEGLGHSLAPKLAFFERLATLFDDWGLPPARIAEGLDAIDAYYASLSHRYGMPVPVPEDAYGSLGWSLVGDEAIEEAERVFRTWVERHPSSVLAAASLGAFLGETRRPHEATVQLRRAVELESAAAEPRTAFLADLERDVARHEAESQEFPELRGPYLGQPPPGDVPEPFAAGLIESPTGFHCSAVWSPAGDRVLWTAQGETILESRRIGGLWTPPVPLPLDPDSGVGEPMFGPGGDRLYFLSRRPPEGDPVVRERIWYVEANGQEWSEPRPIDEVVRAHPTHWQFSFTTRGDLYFTSEVDGTGGGQDIYLARRDRERFRAPESVGPAVNTDLREFTPFVAPDESYLLFARSVPEEKGRSDLFVSFRRQDGRWTTAVNMGDTVNSLHNEVCPVVTPDGRYLFFVRVSGEVNEMLWMSAEVIDSLRDGEFGDDGG